MTERGRKKELVGTVVSDSMQKTVLVETRRHVIHPRYRKVLLRKARFVAHDEKETAGLGDVVRIRESRPLSKTKRWKVVEVVRAAKLREDPEAAAGEGEPKAGGKRATG